MSDAPIATADPTALDAPIATTEQAAPVGSAERAATPLLEPPVMNWREHVERLGADVHVVHIDPVGGADLPEGALAYVGADVTRWPRALTHDVENVAVVVHSSVPCITVLYPIVNDAWSVKRATIIAADHVQALPRLELGSSRWCTGALVNGGDWVVTSLERTKRARADDEADDRPAKRSWSEESA